jgi:hypothetical protein
VDVSRSAQRRGFIEQPINPGLFEPFPTLALFPVQLQLIVTHVPFQLRLAPDPPFESADTVFTVVDLRRGHDFNANLLNETLETTALAVLPGHATGPRWSGEHRCCLPGTPCLHLWLATALGRRQEDRIEKPQPQTGFSQENV